MYNLYGILGVTPCVGVWIEIFHFFTTIRKAEVTPCVGVWIEIMFPPAVQNIPSGHSLRGSVD